MPENKSSLNSEWKRNHSIHIGGDAPDIPCDHKQYNENGNHVHEYASGNELLKTYINEDSVCIVLEKDGDVKYDLNEKIEELDSGSEYSIIREIESIDTRFGLFMEQIIRFAAKMRSAEPPTRGVRRASLARREIWNVNFEEFVDHINADSELGSILKDLFEPKNRDSAEVLSPEKTYVRRTTDEFKAGAEPVKESGSHRFVRPKVTITPELNQAAKAAAKRQGVPYTVWVRAAMRKALREGVDVEFELETEIVLSKQIDKPSV